MVYPNEFYYHETMSESDFIGPDFKARLDRQRILDYSLKRGEISWDLTSGDYSDDGYGNVNSFHKPDYDDWPTIERGAPLELAGIEVTYRDILEQLLADSRSKRPLIALDVGGMAGVTWYRLAHYFKKQVESGKMIFVVTNVEPDFEKLPRQKVDSDNQESNDMEIFKKTKGLVQYITADVMSLRHTKIQVPVKPKVVPLLGSVSLVNERSSVSAHSKIP